MALPWRMCWDIAFNVKTIYLILPQCYLHPLIINIIIDTNYRQLQCLTTNLRKLYQLYQLCLKLNIALTTFKKALTNLMSNIISLYFKEKRKIQCLQKWFEKNYNWSYLHPMVIYQRRLFLLWWLFSIISNCHAMI